MKQITKVKQALTHATIPTSLKELAAWLLDYLEVADEKEFFSPTHPLKISPEAVGISLSELEKTAQTLLHAKETSQTVVIAGDYDADGLCATAVLWLACKAIGLQAQPFIPNRHVHGYGLNERSVSDILTQFSPNLVITVDNGIVAHSAVDQLQARGVTVIITDHHEPTEQLPNALAIVHTTQLCGAGVAWFLARRLLETAISKKQLQVELDNLLELAAIATVADQVPLLETNRSIVFHGLSLLKETQNPGLLALFESAHIDSKAISEWSLSFQVAPRLNALGRMTHGLEALRLLCTQSKTHAAERATKIEKANQERQTVTKELFAIAEQQALLQKDQKILIISGTDFHEGIIGLIAGRLVEAFGKPTLVISQNDLVAKGSARSVSGVHITDFLRQLSNEFLELGGHAMAAGFAVSSKHLPSVTSKLFKLANTEIPASVLEPVVWSFCELDQKLLSLKTVKTLSKFAPFGQSNDRPKFLIRNVQVVSLRTIGKDESHLKLHLRLLNDAESTVYEAVWWGGASATASELLTNPHDFQIELQSHEWRGKTSLQLEVSQAWPSVAQLSVVAN